MRGAKSARCVGAKLAAVFSRRSPVTIATSSIAQAQNDDDTTPFYLQVAVVVAHSAGQYSLSDPFSFTNNAALVFCLFVFFQTPLVIDDLSSFFVLSPFFLYFVFVWPAVVAFANVLTICVGLCTSLPRIVHVAAETEVRKHNPLRCCLFFRQPKSWQRNWLDDIIVSLG